MVIENKFNLPLSLLTVGLSAAVVSLGVYDIYREYYRSNRQVTEQQMDLLAGALFGDFDPQIYADRRRNLHQQAVVERDREMASVRRFFGTIIP